ncbi:MAG: aspartate aminotransferase [Bacteroidetes bacterium GWE2_29_8]|nr:MAG: aspartate aminotransferase [Bacteroidetes bacterium GWE2_29_8]OFY21041.1 MAG: aspartate aminotransferase [Bacteroidetes bacterium GWF2_29_10]
MEALSKRIQSLSESETLAMTKKSRELKAQGFDVINLSIGEPDFFTPNYIKEAAKKAIDENYSFYTPVSGYQDLREAICKKLKRDNNLDYTADQIVVSTGAKQSIANAVLALVNPGEEVIVPAPYWVSYREIVKLAEAKSVYVNATVENDFKVTPQQLRDAITPKTKLIMYSSPCNPTGSVYTKDELEAIAIMLKEFPNIYIIADEIYEKINFSGEPHASMAQFDFIKDRVITVNGISKGYAMTGWRLGYIAAPKFIAQACDKLQGQFTSGTNSITQRATITAMLEETDDIEKMVIEFKKRRDHVINMLKEIPGLTINVPQGAFYIFPKVNHYFGKTDGKTVINNCTDLAMYLINDANVALVQGDAFGDADCIRISYATSIEILTEAINRLKKSLAKLK